MEQKQAKTLLQQASKIAENAYAPYSKFKVGACALYEDGKTYLGCNVENASYGLSNCAEKNALAASIADGNKSKLKAIAIFSPNAVECTPCGSCRQWIFEFSKDAMIILENADREPVFYSIKELLPNGFEF